MSCPCLTYLPTDVPTIIVPLKRCGVAWHIVTVSDRPTDRPTERRTVLPMGTNMRTTRKTRTLVEAEMMHRKTKMKTKAAGGDGIGEGYDDN